MIRIYLSKMVQHDIECYIGKIDPRLLVRVATKIEMSQVQDAQRPLNEKRVKAISNYVSEKTGILPNTLTVATKDNRFKIFQSKELKDIYYLDFPSLDDEFENYSDSIDVMDGQHRLYSFLPDISIIPDTEKYEIGFTLYDKPTLKQRQKIFISCNEKQEKVSANLLLWFKEKLNMLDEDDKRYFGIVNKLGENYPLKGHIIMSAEKVKNGLKAKEIIADLKHIHIFDLTSAGKHLDDDQLVTVLRSYYEAWQEVCNFEFSNSSPKEAGVAVKMAGLKYMTYILPTIWDYTISSHQKFTKDNIIDILKRMVSSLEPTIAYSDFFISDINNSYFRDRTMISRYADMSIDVIKKLDSEDFDPLS